jgi:hypothetical protein
MRSAAIRTARVPAHLQRARGVPPALESWLAQADLARHGLPAGAIVLVRRLGAPWAQLTSPDAGRRYAALADVLSRAARPARGESGHEAVWFSDESELLACLARDALAGVLGLRWWWRVLLPDPGLQAARQRWIDSPRELPRALVGLGPTAARAWLESWPQQDRAALVRALAQVFPLSARVQAWAVAREGHAPVGDAQGQASRGQAGDLGAGPVAWPAAQRLVVLACAIRDDAMAGLRVPVANRPGRAAAPLERPRPVRARQPLQHPSAVRGGNAAARDEARAASAGAAAVVPPGRPTGENAALMLPAPRAWGEGSAGAAQSGIVPGAVLSHAIGIAPGAGQGMPEDPPRSVTQPQAGPAPAVAVPEAPVPPVHADDLCSAAPRAFTTRFGGLLFLLNAALQIGLYGDFTQPRRAGLACSPWRFLLSAGHALGGKAFARDPLAGWLRQRVAASGAVRRPWQQRCRALLAAECQRVGLPVTGNDRAPWALLRARLVAALGLPDARRLAATLLRLPARVEDAAERIDVTLALADLPLAVRLAGLDRDAGWIPAAGCDLRFHFR